MALDTRSETCRAADGSDRTLEVATIAHDGREFAARGAEVDHVDGRILAYWTAIPSGNVPTSVYSAGGRIGGLFNVTTWAGEFIALAHITGKWRNSTPGAYGEQWRYSFTFRHAGYEWHGIGHGAGMYLRAKRGAKITN